MKYVLPFVLGCLVTTSFAANDRPRAEWSRFRGPNGSGVIDGEKPPIEFGPSSRVLWKTAVPPGISSPILAGNRLFLTALEKATALVIAFDRRTGQRLWTKPLPATELEKVHAFSSPAASTPAADRDRLYVYLPSYGVVAYDLNGKEIWRLPVPLPRTQYGSATSPILVGGTLVLQLDGNSGTSELLALDARTGAVAWRTPRLLLRESWSTPIVWRNNGEDEIITLGSGRLVAHSARDGSERWWAAGLTNAPITGAVYGNGLLFASARGTGSPSEPMDVPQWQALVEAYDSNKDSNLAAAEMPTDVGIHLRKEVPKETPGNFMSLRRVMAHPLVDTNKDGVVTPAEWNNVLKFMEANHDNVMAVRPGGTGDISTTHVVWRGNRGVPEIPSPIFYRDRVYFVRDGGMVTSYEATTGRILLDRARLGALGQYVASLVAADGRIYAASEPGTVVVFRAGDTLEVLARNDLGESIKATPAIADNTLYVRTAGHLWAFR